MYFGPDHESGSLFAVHSAWIGLLGFPRFIHAELNALDGNEKVRQRSR